MFDFEGKVALVTGGTQGMGSVTAEALSAAGARVVICGRDEEKGHAAAACLTAKTGKEVRFLYADIADADSVKSLIDAVVADYGHLDVAFNNAGVTSEHACVADASVENWHRTISINVNGTFHAMKYEIGAMLKNGGGAIVNNSSLLGIVPISGQPAYCTSKAAILTLTKSAAMEYAREDNGRPRIRINAVAPGPILGGMNTEENLTRNPERTKRKLALTAMNRFGTPEEVVTSVLWLLSPQSSYVTGAVIPVDGGGSAGKF
jgi:NAD(P)-dependent dehydrogenase (short-subunit alcohol dehydrogenase family)